MRTENDLRQTLTEHADLAGAVDDVAAAIGTGIARSARRRRLALVTGGAAVAVTAVVAGGAALPAAGTSRHAHPAATPSASPTVRARGATMLAPFPVDLSPWPGYTLVGEQAEPDNDAHSVRLARGTEVVEIGIARGDHVKEQAGGQQVTVQGRPARYDASQHTVRWYRPDLGLTLYFGSLGGRDAVLVQAEKVRPGGQLWFALPLRSGTLPAGYVVTTAFRHTDGARSQQFIQLELASPRGGRVTLKFTPDRPGFVPGTAITTPAGRPAFYQGGADAEPWLTAGYDACWVQAVGQDSSQAELTGIVDGLRVTDFTNPATWTDRPLAVR